MTKKNKLGLRLVTPEEPKLTNFDRIVIGKAVRVEIPFTDIYKMRRIADLLRGLAEDLDFSSRRTDHPPLDTAAYSAWRRHLLFYLRFRTSAVNREIRELHGKHNKNGTTR